MCVYAQAALKGAKVSMEELLSQHKKREEGRWEVRHVSRLQQQQ